MLRNRVTCLAALASVSLMSLAAQAGNQNPPPVPKQEIVVPGAVLVPAPLEVRPMTLAEFAEAFKPAPGTYEVVLLHPDTCCPVKVCFTLPCGCPKKVKLHKRTLTFVYDGCEKVRIRMALCGTARVT
ncbi:MAG TPA: hypothetical protein VGZ25_09445, partial [Gemmataceae bacterium]|nr:hypothetical protein [Gemmataceae bacterium]